uniref:SNF2 N-terminal domain-containing protein n=1 Tax=Anopheles atroparvus TaxID=41427 RepID=A0AAG5D771_ANOAO
MDVHCLPTKEAVTEGHLILDTACDRFVHRRIVVQLAVHQLEGVRFLNCQLREYSGIFLNDESGLGKCYQIVALLSGTAVGDRPSIILCPNRERTHHWMYHLDLLAPSLRSRVHPKSQLEVANELTALRGTEWQYAIVDETRGFMTTAELERLRALAVQKYIFLSSRDLLGELMVLSARLEFSCGKGAEALRSMVEQGRKQQTKTAYFRIYLCTRRFILRRRARNYRRQLPLIRKSEFLERFNAWKVANDIEVSQTVGDSADLGSVEYSIPTVKSQESSFFPVPGRTMTPEATDNTHRSSDMSESCSGFLAGQKSSEAGRTSPVNVPEATPLHYTGSEPLFDMNETNTEQMPHLRVESDTPSEGGSSIPEGGINIPETDTDTGGGTYAPVTATDSEGYLQFGQQVSDGSTSTQPVLADERYRFPVEKFLPQPAGSKQSGSSLSGESITSAQPPAPVITISSSDSPANRSKSPPLFEDDTENDTLTLSSDDDISLLDLLKKSATKRFPSRGASPKIATDRRLPSFSTPIAKLMFGSLADATPQREVDASSVDMFGVSPIGPVVAVAAAAAPEDVFEITKNNAFPNRIVVQGAAGGIPTVRIADESSDDDVQFVDATDGAIALDDPSGTPTGKGRSKALSLQRTPPSGGSNLGASPGRGWLGKSLRTSSISPRSSSTTPTTTRKDSPGGSGGVGSSYSRGGVHIVRDANRRRKLEELFKDVDGCCNSDLAKRSRTRVSEAKTNRR